MTILRNKPIHHTFERLYKEKVKSYNYRTDDSVLDVDPYGYRSNRHLVPVVPHRDVRAGGIRCALAHSNGIQIAYDGKRTIHTLQLNGYNSMCGGQILYYARNDFHSIGTLNGSNFRAMYVTMQELLGLSPSADYYVNRSGKTHMQIQQKGILTAVLQVPKGRQVRKYYSAGKSFFDTVAEREARVDGVSISVATGTHTSLDGTQYDVSILHRAMWDAQAAFQSNQVVCANCGNHMERPPGATYFTTAECPECGSLVNVGKGKYNDDHGHDCTREGWMAQSDCHPRGLLGTVPYCGNKEYKGYSTLYNFGNNPGRRRHDDYEHLLDDTLRATLGGYAGSEYNLCGELAKRPVLISTNVGQAPSYRTRQFMALFWRMRAILLEDYGITVLMPDELGTNPREHHHAIDSMALLVTDVQKFKSALGGSINES